MDKREKLLEPGAICLDLGAAPGAWSEYARRKLGRTGRVMDPLEGVEFVQGDFCEQEVFDRIQAALPERQVDLVLSDMAPLIERHRCRRSASVDVPGRAGARCSIGRPGS